MNGRGDVIRQARELARCKVNDAVKLAFLKEDGLERLDGMDLSAVTEFRRQSNGLVEMKFIDRLAVLKWLSELEGTPWGEDFYQALRRDGEKAED